MKHLSILALAVLVPLAACDKKKEKDTGTAKPTTGTTAPSAPAAPTAPAAPAAPAPAANAEIDLSPWGGPFAGLVATAPAGSKVTFDDPSRQLSIGDENENFLSVSEAPYYADGVASLSKDPDNSNLKIVSDTEARWERNPPLGKEWNFDVKIDVGGAAYSCGGSTFTSAAVADQLVAICKSIKKK